MGRTTQQAETAVFEILKQAPKSKKVIYKRFKDETLNLERKYVKKALKKLHRRGKIIKTGKIYSLVALSSSSTTTTGCTPLPTTNTTSTTTNNNNNNNDDEKKDQGDNNNDIKEAIPIAEKLRQNSKKQRTKKKVSFVEPSEEQAIVVDDIDEEIKRLEMELQQQESDSESELESEGSFDDDKNDSTPSKQRDEEYRRGTEDGENRQQDNDVLCLSKYANDRIETLPSSYLPLPGRYDSNDNKKKKKSKHKSTKSDGDRNNEVGRVQNHESRPSSRGSGLESAVKELLQGYQARSSERLPFYCRFCSRQYQNESEFFNHKNTEFHMMAVAMERKATYCRLCRKQLTSPEQMKEHLSSKPHKERLEKMRNRTRSINNNSQQQVRAQQQGGGGGGSCIRKFHQPKYSSSSIHRQWG